MLYVKYCCTDSKISSSSNELITDGGVASISYTLLRTLQTRSLLVVPLRSKVM